MKGKKLRRRFLLPTRMVICFRWVMGLIVLILGFRLFGIGVAAFYIWAGEQKAENRKVFLPIHQTWWEFSRRNNTGQNGPNPRGF